LVLVGAADQRAADISKELFISVTAPGTPVHVLGLTTAEIVKMALNCWTTMKISFANMVGQIMIRAGQGNEITQALRAVGDSKRCGQAAMQFGFGYGGPCLPRDNRSLYNYAKDVGVDYELGNLVDQFNDGHAEFLASYFWELNSQQLPFYFDHVSYKRGVTFTEESHQLKICKNILKRGGQVIIEPTEYLLEETQRELSAEFSSQVCFEKLENISYPVYKINI
jgi:UDP-glucose 6-dehydrogenase